MRLLSHLDHSCSVSSSRFPSYMALIFYSSSNCSSASRYADTSSFSTTSSFSSYPSTFSSSPQLHPFPMTLLLLLLVCPSSSSCSSCSSVVTSISSQLPHSPNQLIGQIVFSQSPTCGHPYTVQQLRLFNRRACTRALVRESRLALQIDGRTVERT